MQLRLNMTEFHLRVEVSQMKAMCSLQRSKAGREEIEMAFSNIREAEEENCEILRLKCQSKYLKILETERSKQENSILDYENERFSSIINNSKNYFLILLQMSTSFLRIKGEIREVLSEKQKMIESNLNERFVPKEMIVLTIKQIEAEVDREQSELSGVYSSLISSITLSERLVTEMVESFIPSFSYTKELSFYGFLNESEQLFEALKKNFLHEKCIMKIISSNFHKNFEENRLRDLNRSGDDLTKIHLEIDNRLKEDIKELNNEYKKEKKHLELLLLSQFNEKKKNLIAYEEEVKTLVEEHSLILNNLKSTHTANQLEIKEKRKDSSTDVLDKEVRRK